MVILGDMNTGRCTKVWFYALTDLINVDKYYIFTVLTKEVKRKNNKACQFQHSYQLNRKSGKHC
jgi:hypothetical protein